MSTALWSRPSAVSRLARVATPPAVRRQHRHVASAAAALQPEPAERGKSGAEKTDPARPDRRDAIRNAKPFSAFLTDGFDRQHDYLRISLTEKCNLRCLYCMPEEGVPQSPPRELLTSPEIFLLSSLFVSQGVTKIRLTGGEPTIRRDILPLMQQIGTLRNNGLKELCITTNGVSLHRKLDGMVEAGLTGVNLSLDTLDPFQFQIMTRRKGFEAVMKSIERILEMNKRGAGIKLKINCVVMRGLNDREIIPFVELGRTKDIEVRFIEYMPFDGNKWSQGKMLSYNEMLEAIQQKYPTLRKVQDAKNDTSKTYEIPGFAGRIGFITSMTHNFCGTCNRLRITSDGNLKVCLFGNAEVSLRDILRKSNGGEPIDDEAFAAIEKLEQSRQGDSPATLGSHAEAELLEVIGLAVKRKKAAHAGMGVLENMKNRPMILIDSQYYGSSCGQLTPVDRASRPQPWQRIPLHLFRQPGQPSARFYSTKSSTQPAPAAAEDATSSSQRLTHLTSSGDAHMVSISGKASTKRTAVAACAVCFSNAAPLPLIRACDMQKGDVLGVARVAGIMAAKRTPDLIPLCHPIAISHVALDVSLADAGAPARPFGCVEITATVSCVGATGVEMEALTAASTAALTVYDMCKAVDKGMRIEGLRVIRKEGGKSGLWVAP